MRVMLYAQRALPEREDGGGGISPSQTQCCSFARRRTRPLVPASYSKTDCLRQTEIKTRLQPSGDICPFLHPQTQLVPSPLHVLEETQHNEGHGDRQSGNEPRESHPDFFFANGLGANTNHTAGNAQDDWESMMLLYPCWMIAYLQKNTE